MSVVGILQLCSLIEGCVSIVAVVVVFGSQGWHVACNCCGGLRKSDAPNKLFVACGITVAAEHGVWCGFATTTHVVSSAFLHAPFATLLFIPGYMAHPTAAFATPFCFA